MAGLKWKIGNVEVFQLIELEDAGRIIQEVIKDATPKNIQDMGWLNPYFADDAGILKAHVQSFLIKSENKNILIDTCNGNDKRRTDLPQWGNLRTNFLSDLRDLGVDERDVNVVVCTHLHCDHIGWNTRLQNGSWIPTFPNAKYLIARKEYDYWKEKPEKEIADDKAAFDDSITPITDAGLAELVDMNYNIDGHIKFIPTPGHTPHHMSVVIESLNQRAIIAGDLFHHPCQISQPQWTTLSDTIPSRGIISRQKILNEICDADVLLIGSHFANPVAGHVVRENGKLMLKV